MQPFSIVESEEAIREEYFGTTSKAYPRILVLFESFVARLITEIEESKTYDKNVDVNFHVIQPNAETNEFRVKFFGETYRFVLQATYSEGAFLGYVTCQILDRLTQEYKAITHFHLPTNGVTNVKIGEGNTNYVFSRSTDPTILIMAIAKAYMSGQLEN